jgi:putative ABC transport system ATP-binding protein
MIKMRGAVAHAGLLQLTTSNNRIDKNLMTYAVQANNVSKYINSGELALPILQNINLQIEQGATAAIVGPSGVGKTTLLSLLAGLDTASEGQITLAGTDISACDEETRTTLRAGRIGFVFQSFQLLPSYSALENVVLAAELANIPSPRDAAIRALESVGLGHRLKHVPSRLSGGEQQRVALARAFVGKPEILFADEPTGNLDAKTGAGIIEQLFALNADAGTTLILVTHDPALASQCQQVWQLSDQGLTLS